MTMIHEKGSELHWKDVRELVVGEYIPSATDSGGQLASQKCRHSSVEMWRRQSRENKDLEFQALLSAGVVA